MPTPDPLPPLYERIGGHEGILKFIRPFYADIRQHAVLGPIFNSHIKDWPAHLDKITEFWARQMGGPSRYQGGFAAVHLQLGVGPEHFGHWLTLWDFNCQRNLPQQEAAEVSELAHLLGERLQHVLKGRSGLRIGGTTATN